MRRYALGIIAAFLIVIGAIGALGGPGGDEAKQFSGVCIKSGLVLGALWLALPQLQSLLTRAPRWFFSWFVGKKKNQASGGGQPSGPPPPRPRRRSNTL